MKEEGNIYFKEKDYKKALSKYTRVQCYTNVIMPPKDNEFSKFTQMSQKSKVCPIFPYDLIMIGNDSEC